MRPLAPLLCSAALVAFLPPAGGRIPAADPAAGVLLKPTVVRLWQEIAPGAQGNDDRDIPTIATYAPAPEQRTGASVLILPGGGYGHLAEHEGKGYADWFVARGVTAHVLKYRLGPAYRHPTMLQDASRGLRLTRAYARREGLDPRRIGVIGSSAGGHLAATLLTQFTAANPAADDVIDRESSRPDLGILCYPVITLGEFTHAGSKRNLLGPEPPDDLVRALSAELNVTPETPPCFLWSTGDDKTVPIENSLLFVSALRKAGVPFALHVYETGPHGLGFGRPGKPAPPWGDALEYWLRERKFLP